MNALLSAQSFHLISSKDTSIFFPQPEGPGIRVTT